MLIDVLILIAIIYNTVVGCTICLYKISINDYYYMNLVISEFVEFYLVVLLP